ncbi:MAG: CpsD/CapB family tyrosine-protein kinase [Oscillospiraceae bacterium]|nr:CpsD/CapB family tyrosine-protein kinase [Oscillospiraceae bacterium]
MLGNKKNLEQLRNRQIEEARKNLLTPDSNFFVREAYKALRTNVSFALTGDSKSKVVVLTSALQSEGKSTTAINLAISYAMTDCKVLIIDCDMRRPKLARLLQLGNKVGMSNLLLDPSLLDQAIIHTDKSGLDVILAGSIPPNPSELLGSSRMQTLLEELRSRYDYVFIDSPPVNMVTDALVVAPNSDGVVFLVRANQSERGAVTRALDQLEYAKIKVLGFVLNGLERDRSYYGYSKKRYKRYYSYKKYGYGKYGYGKYGYGKYGYHAAIAKAYEADADEEADD